MKSWRTYLLTALLGLPVAPLLAQQQNLRLPQGAQSVYDAALEMQSPEMHTVIKPILESEIDEAVLDSLHGEVNSSRVLIEDHPLTSEHAVHLKSKTLDITLDPLFNYTIFSASNSDSILSEGAVGLRLAGDITKKFSFDADFQFANSRFPQFIVEKIQRREVVPGQGYAYSLSNGGYRYHNASGYVSYTPSKHFNIQLGRDKHFWGEGHRSLFLSHAANNFNFAKLTTNVWRIKYVNLFAQFDDITASMGDPENYVSKFGTFHYLDFNISKRVTFGLFESVIWQGQDSTGYRGFDVNYLNPIIFLRPVEFSLGSPDNVLIGAGLKVRHFGNNYFYAQLLLDEFLLDEVRNRTGWWGNKHAFQLGFKGYHPFKIKNLFYRFEYNWVRPYTYTHLTVQQNYGHFNDPLAHPLGANFTEALAQLRYRIGRFYFEGKLVSAIYGTDGSPNVSYGQDIFKSYLLRPSEYDHEITQGVRNELLHAELRISFLINTAMNLRLETGLINRSHSVAGNDDNSTFLFLGIRTSLREYYYDY